MLSFVLANSYWLLVPYIYCFTYNSYSVLGFIVVMGLSVYVHYLAGMSRCSKYAYLGAIRAARQTISYELVFTTLVLCFAVM